MLNDIFLSRILSRLCLMPTVKKDIQETSKKISHVKKIIKKRVESLDDSIVQQTPISSGTNWKDLDFSKPEKTIRIGTMFSGIGAIEHAFQRLGLKHKIAFAGDIEPNCKKSLVYGHQRFRC